MRRSLNAGAGRVGRLWVEEVVPADPREPTGLLLAAEVRGFDAGRELGDDEREEVADDLRRRAAEDGDVDLENDPHAVRVAVFAAGESDSLAEYLRGTEPVFGEARGRVMNLAELRAMLPAPRRLPRAMPIRPEQDDAGSTVMAIVIQAVVGLGLAALAAWLVPWPWVRWPLVGLILGATGFVAWATWRELPSVAIGRRGPLRGNPLTLAAVVQAFEALWVADHPDYPQGARFGLVLVYSLDPRRRDDPAWLNWLARRLAWLRDNGAEDPDETRIAQRLEGEADDRTSRLPAGVTGNDATYWASPMIVRYALPGSKLPADGLVPVLLEATATPGAERVELERVWPGELWPLRDRPPWAGEQETRRG